MRAISHGSLDVSQIKRLDRSARPTYYKFLEFLKMRRSRREFRDEPVSAEEIEKLIWAGAQAPSALNRQSVEYTVITDREAIKQLSNQAVVFLRRLAGVLHRPPSNMLFRAFASRLHKGLSHLLPLIDRVVQRAEFGEDPVLYDAPCVILLHAPKSDMYAPGDALYSASNMLLAAETLGLGMCIIDLITQPAKRDPALKRISGIPADHDVFVTMAVGQPRFRYSYSVPKREPKVHYRGPFRHTEIDPV